jgi:hypothetical protein
MTHGTLTHQIVLRDKTHLASSKDEFRPAMLHLYIKNRFCFATDSFILAVGRIQEDFAKEPSFEGIIPIEIVNQFWKSKSAFKRIDIWESQDTEGKKTILASCDDLVKPLIDEKFPPIIEFLYRQLQTYKTNVEDYHRIRLNTDLLTRLASAQGKIKGEVNLLLSKSTNASLLYCDSGISNDSNFGIVMLCREDNIDLNSDFWIKEIRHIADPEETMKCNKEVEKENTKAIEKRIKAEDTAVKRLEFLQDWLASNHEEISETASQEMDKYFYSREVTEELEEAA